MSSKNKIIPTHGGDIQGFAHEAGCSPEHVVDFSSNINPLGMPDSVKEAYHSSFDVISKYPDAQSQEMHEVLAGRHHLSATNVLAGNGSIALIDLIIRSLKPKSALLIEPCFNEYRRLLQLSNVAVDHIVLKEENNFQLPFDEILKQFKKTDLLILGHPNNPTGTALSLDALAHLINYASQMGKYIVIDEAFIDWNSNETALEYVPTNSSVIVLRSLTKFYSLAGIRAGYACAHENIIDQMRVFQETWGCNGLAQKLSVAAVCDEEFQLRSLEWFKEEYTFMFDTLSQIPFIKVFPSKANFFLCKVIKLEMIEMFWQSMSQSKIYLREADNFIGLNKSYFRVALKTRKENCYFLEQVKAISKGQQSIHDGTILSVHS